MAIVTAVESKTTSTGKTYSLVTLADGRKVSVWNDHPLYVTMHAGIEIPDTLIYQKGNYWNLSNPERTTASPRAPRASAARSADIKEAQDRKETSITFFNATNAAIALVGNDTTITEPETIKKWVRYWRDWFIAEHDAYKNHKERYPVDDPLADTEPTVSSEALDDIGW